MKYEIIDYWIPKFLMLPSCTIWMISFSGYIQDDVCFPLSSVHSTRVRLSIWPWLFSHLGVRTSTCWHSVSAVTHLSFALVSDFRTSAMISFLSCRSIISQTQLVLFSLGISFAGSSSPGRDPSGTRH